MTTPSATDTPGLGTWYYQVIARDAVGNKSTPSTETRVFVATTKTVTPTADTWANEGAPTQVNGTATILFSRSSTGAVPYLRFVLPPVPDGTRLTAAVLRLHTTTNAACGCTTAGSVNSQNVRFAADTWDESTLNWANRPALSGPVLGTLGATGENLSYDVVLDITPLTPLTARR